MVVLEFLKEEATWKTNDDVGKYITMDLKVKKVCRC